MEPFPSIDEVEMMLEKAAEKIPQPFYDGLNLGIALLPDRRLHPQGHGDLFVLGEYDVSMAGCGITIYYGSFATVFAGDGRATIEKELEHTLRHEFWHHMEHRAGENALEREDEEELEAYQHQYALRRGEHSDET